MNITNPLPIPLWLVLALAAVVGKTAYYILQKRLLDEDTSSIKLGYITSIYGVVLVAPVGLYQVLSNAVTLTTDTLAILIGLGVIELIGLIVYLEALAATEISIASPLKKSKPVLIGVIEPFLFGIVFNPILIIAASLTGVGGFVVLADDLNLRSLKERLNSRGPKLAIAAALIYTVLSLGSRFGNAAVGPFVFGTVIFTVMLIGYYLLLKRTGTTAPKKTLLSRDYLLVGLTGIGRSVFVWGAYALAAATVVTSVTQLTILLDVLIGGHLFSEGNLKQKAIGSVMILVGVLIVITV